MYRPEHVAAWRRIVAFVHEHSAARICLQLGHAGPKGSVKLPWEGTDIPLEQDGWEAIGPSAVRYAPWMPVPRAMTRADMDRVRDDFVARHARWAWTPGFDMLELHCAHGYLLSSFITPLANQRTDEYGGSLENRLRYPLEVFAAMRAAWPAERPMSVRISATDWVEGGLTRRGRRRDRPRLRRRRRRHRPRVHRADLDGRPAGLRPHVPDAVQRPDAQRRRRADHRRRQHHRGRPGEQHHRRGSRRPLRAGASAPERSVLDAARRRRVPPRRAGVAGAVSDRTPATRARGREKGHARHDRIGHQGAGRTPRRRHRRRARASARRSPRRSRPRAPTSR